jgi:hypothetical protein
MSTEPVSDGPGSFETGVGVGGGSGVGVPGMNSLQARVASTSMDRIKISFLTFTGFSSNQG